MITQLNALIRKLDILIVNYPDRIGPSGKFVGNSTNAVFLQITGNLIKYSIILWLLEFEVRRGRNYFACGCVL
jgi:hypothetical protein